MNEYDWDDIIEKMKGFTRVEDIDDIVILGENGGVRRIKVTPYEPFFCDKCGQEVESWELQGCFVESTQTMWCDDCVEEHKPK